MKNEAKFDHNLYQVETAHWHKKFVVALSLIMSFYFHQTHNLYSSFNDIMTSNDIFTETKAYLSVQNIFINLRDIFNSSKDIHQLCALSAQLLSLDGTDWSVVFKQNENLHVNSHNKTKALPLTSSTTVSC